jgi:murein DD-endopeptidase MepM/ murein hydrolase activator NlpD
MNPFISSSSKLILGILFLALTSCSTAQQRTISSENDLTGSAHSKSECSMNLSLNADEFQGGSLLLVNAESLETLDKNGTVATLGDLQAPFFQTGPNQFQAILAIPSIQSPGAMEVQITSMSEPNCQESIPFKVVDRTVSIKEKISVSRKFTRGRRKGIIVSQRTGRAASQLFQKVTLRKYWNGPFLPPVESHITSPFGTQRTFNRKLRTFHSGVDFHAPSGTPIHPSAAGIVVLSRRLFSTGHTIIIDHGYGVFTIYAHLSRRNVKIGSEVSTDTVIGLSGKTGRAHGAHLHWGAVVQGVKVDSLDLLKWLS